MGDPNPTTVVSNTRTCSPPYVCEVEGDFGFTGIDSGPVLTQPLDTGDQVVPPPPRVASTPPAAVKLWGETEALTEPFLQDMRTKIARVPAEQGPFFPWFRADDRKLQVGKSYSFASYFSSLPEHFQLLFAKVKDLPGVVFSPQYLLIDGKQVPVVYVSQVRVEDNPFGIDPLLNQLPGAVGAYRNTPVQDAALLPPEAQVIRNLGGYPIGVVMAPEIARVMYTADELVVAKHDSDFPVPQDLFPVGAPLAAPPFSATLSLGSIPKVHAPRFEAAADLGSNFTPAGWGYLADANDLPAYYSLMHGEAEVFSAEGSANLSVNTAFVGGITIEARGIRSAGAFLARSSRVLAPFLKLAGRTLGIATMGGVPDIPFDVGLAVYEPGDPNERLWLLVEQNRDAALGFGSFLIPVKWLDTMKRNSDESDEQSHVRVIQSTADGYVMDTDQLGEVLDESLEKMFMAELLASGKIDFQLLEDGGLKKIVPNEGKFRLDMMDVRRGTWNLFSSDKRIHQSVAALYELLEFTGFRAKRGEAVKELLNSNGEPYHPTHFRAYCLAKISEWKRQAQESLKRELVSVGLGGYDVTGKFVNYYGTLNHYTPAQQSLIDKEEQVKPAYQSGVKIASASNPQGSWTLRIRMLDIMQRTLIFAEQHSETADAQLEALAPADRHAVDQALGQLRRDPLKGDSRLYTPWSPEDQAEKTTLIRDIARGLTQNELDLPLPFDWQRQYKMARTTSASFGDISAAYMSQGGSNPLQAEKKARAHEALDSAQRYVWKDRSLTVDNKFRIDYSLDGDASPQGGGEGSIVIRQIVKL